MACPRMQRADSWSEMQPPLQKAKQGFSRNTTVERAAFTRIWRRGCVGSSLGSEERALQSGVSLDRPGREEGRTWRSRRRRQHSEGKRRKERQTQGREKIQDLMSTLALDRRLPLATSTIVAKFFTL